MPESRSRVVHGYIIRNILSGTYRPGQALNRREVAKSLDVSISPVNEAFAILQTEGILATLPRKGTFVGRLDWRDLTELTIVRAALESEAARRYCGVRIGVAREQMLHLADKVDRAVPLTSANLHADTLFHRALVALAGNRLLSSLFDMVITRSLLLAMEASISAHGTPERSSHRDFVYDLCGEIPESVGEVVRRHLFSGKETVGENFRLNDQDSASSPALDLILSILEEAK